MISLLVLRKKEPDLERPFKVPLYPLSPYLALIIASVAFLAITVYNPTLALIYFAILLVAYMWFRMSYQEEN
jgi:ethanolamine permease